MRSGVTVTEAESMPQITSERAEVDRLSRERQRERYREADRPEKRKDADRGGRDPTKYD